MSLPYEPGRAAFASLERTAADLASLGRGRIEELPPARPAGRSPASRISSERSSRTRRLRRRLSPVSSVSSRARARASRTSWSGRRSSACCARGVRAEEIAVVCPSSNGCARRSRPPSRRSGIPFAVEARRRLSQTSFGQALAALLRYVWLEGGRPDLYGFLRSPYSGLTRAHVDYPRGAAARTCRPSGPWRRRPSAPREADPDPRPGARGRSRSQPSRCSPSRCCAPPTGWRRRRSASARSSTCAPSRRPRGSSTSSRAGSAWASTLAARRSSPRSSGPPSAAPRRRAGPRAVLDPMRARTRRYEIVFVLGLEEGSLPRRAHSLAVPRRRRAGRLDERTRGAPRPPRPVARERYLFYAACTRAARRALPRPRGGDRRRLPARREPVLGRDRGRSSTRTRWRAGRRGAALGADLAARARADRARAAARPGGPAAGPAPPRRSRARTAGSAGWSAPAPLSTGRPPAAPGRARGARGRRRPSASPSSRRSRTARRSGSSSGSSSPALDRRPARTPAARLDRPLRRSPFFAGLPKELGTERVEPARSTTRSRSCASASTRRSRACGRSSPTLERRELEQGSARDLEHFVRDEARARSCRSSRAASRSRSAPSARRRSCSAGSTWATLRALGEDRPDRRRPVLCARDRPGLQVGEDGLLGGEDRLRAAPADPAVHARPARPGRDRAARRPLPGARRRAGCARAPARGGQGRSARLPVATTTATRTSSGGRSRPGEERATVARRADPRRRRASTIRKAASVPAVVRAVVDVPGEARMSTRRTPSSSPRSRLRASSSSPPAPGRGRRRCSSSAMSARSASAGSTSTPSS